MYLTFYKKHTNAQPAQLNYSLEDLFTGVPFELAQPTTNIKQNFETMTVITDNLPTSYNNLNLEAILAQLQNLTVAFKDKNLNDYYKTFYIPKRSGGLRKIDAPNEELMEALKMMKEILQYRLNILYHNRAFAYVPHRNIKNALEVHQQHHSKWFLKLDIKDFFTNCTQDFVINSLLQIYPFAMWNKEQIESFIWLCFKDGGLPQGTPMSPMLTNIIMIPIDYAINKYAKENKLIYTRYADDILLSSKTSFNWKQTIKDLNKIFRSANAPFKIKDEKTRYGSSAGRNWNLGLMLNKDNNITVGYRNKKNYKAMLNNLLIAESSAQFWDQDQIYYFQGITSYYLSIEPEYFKKLITKYETIYNITLKEIYKRTL